MERIFKTWKKATYFKGNFELRDENSNYASPIEFPTIFTAFGAAIKSGNWQSCTSINTPDYVINDYFNNIGHKKYDEMYILWEYCKKLSIITWENVKNNETNILELIRLANYELGKLNMLA